MCRGCAPAAVLLQHPLVCFLQDYNNIDNSMLELVFAPAAQWISRSDEDVIDGMWCSKFELLANQLMTLHGILQWY